jgi:fucose 4-O-acetylase-like acetyltransferase
MGTLNDLLEPIASQFRSLGMPQPIVHWGHPLMMSIVILAMGSAVGIAGWRGRLATDIAEKQKKLSSHRQIAPWMFLFLALGYTGGILSLVMQRESILESSHFWTGSVVLILLTVQAVLSLSGFWGDRSSLRKIHAYVGSSTLILAIVHMVLGLKLGLAI